MLPGRLSVVTLGARDKKNLAAFYKALGWKPVIEMEGDITVFQLRGALLSLFPIEKLAEDGKTSEVPPTDGIGLTLAVIVDEKKQVDTAISEVRTAGARVTKEPRDEAWGGRSAYFADPENNYWEVVWLPEGNMRQAVRKAGGF